MGWGRWVWLKLRHHPKRLRRAGLTPSYAAITMSKRASSDSRGCGDPKRARAALSHTQLCRKMFECKHGQDCAFAHSLSSLQEGRAGWDAPRSDLTRLKTAARDGVVPPPGDMIWPYLQEYWRDVSDTARVCLIALMRNQEVVPSKNDVIWEEAACCLRSQAPDWAETLFWGLVQKRCAAAPKEQSQGARAKSKDDEEDADEEDEEEEYESSWTGARTSEEEELAEEEEEGIGGGRGRARGRTTSPKPRAKPVVLAKRAAAAVPKARKETTETTERKAAAVPKSEVPKATTEGQRSPKAADPKATTEGQRSAKAAVLKEAAVPKGAEECTSFST